MCESTARNLGVSGNGTRTLGAVLGAILLAATGCIVDEPPSESLAAFASAFTATFCQSLETCCVDWNFSRSVCERSMQWLDIAASSARRGHFVYHEQAAARCLADLQRADLCQEHVPASCARVFESQLGPGEVCESALDCPPDPGGYSSCALEADGAHRCAGAAVQGERCAWTCADDGFCVSNGGLPTGKTCHLRQGLHCGSSGTCEGVGAVESIKLGSSTASVCDPNELDPCPGHPCSNEVCGQPDSFICVVGLGNSSD